MSLSLFTPETDVCWVIREQHLVFLSISLPTWGFFRAEGGNELIALGCLIPGTGQQLEHYTCNETEMGEQKVCCLEDIFCWEKTNMMGNLEHSATLFRTGV